MVKNLINALFVFLIAGTLCAQEQAPPFYLLTNARIFDVESGTSGDELKTILIAGNTIEDVNSSSGASGVSNIDLGGRFVMPGLIDLHSHLLLHPYDEATWNEQVLNESLELRTIRGTVAARNTLAAGFTTLRDLGTEGAGFADIALRDAINQDIIPGPRVFTVTKALVTTGGYGPMGFDPRWQMPSGAQVADGVAECRKVTREQIAAGADWIKVYADYRRRAGDVSTPTFSEEELKAIVSEATSAGIPVAAHATTEEGIRRSVGAGVKTIEHGYEASLDTLRFMKAQGVVLCPTLTASESMARYSGWNPERDPEHPRITTAKTLMKNALESGVTIACGSDVGVFTHGDNARELELMYAFGMPVEDVIRSATITAASVLGQEKLGQVKPGYLADLIVVEEDPAKSLATLRNPLVVIKDGKVEVNQLNQSSASSDEITLMVPLDSNPNTAEAIKQLEMSSPQIIEITELPAEESTADSTETKSVEKGDSNASVFTFRVELDGSFSRDGEIIPKGDLARMIAQQLKNGVKDAKVIASEKLDGRKLLETQSWLKNLGVDTVYFEVIDEETP